MGKYNRNLIILEIKLCRKIVSEMKAAGVAAKNQAERVKVEKERKEIFNQKMRRQIP